ncbi:MAG: hypothetical protein ACREUT_17435 [Steroidobacteraceae bacterium]
MSLPKLPKKVSFPELEVAAEGLDGCVRALANGFPDLRVVDRANLEVGRAVRGRLGSRFVFRHAEQDDLRLSLMKLVHISSANHAAIELISAGYTQEVDVLWQMIDEAYKDIVLMIGAPKTTDQCRVIDGTFQEKFDSPDEITSPSKRDLVRLAQSSQPRADVSRRDPAAMQDLASVGAIRGDPRIAEAVQSQANYLYRSLLVAELIARRTRRTDVMERVCALAADLARISGCDAPPTGRSGEDWP